jgi:hypothetical protein
VQDKITESDIYNFFIEIIPTFNTEKKCDAIVNKPILNISGGGKQQLRRINGSVI